jgi:hypothetical protein
MKKIFNFVIFILILLTCFAQIDHEEDMTDEEIEREGQKDMVAFMQYTAPYRFSSELSVGDRVEYIDKFNNELYLIEVLEKNEKFLLIHEKFEDNEVYLKLDINSKKVIAFWGTDESGNIHVPELLNDVEIDLRIQRMSANIDLISEDLKYTIESTKNVKINGKDIECDRIKVQIPIQENLNTEIGEILLNEDIPKMIPMNASYELIEEKNPIKNSSKGLVEYMDIELLNVVKNN